MLRIFLGIWYRTWQIILQVKILLALSLMCTCIWLFLKKRKEDDPDSKRKKEGVNMVIPYVPSADNSNLSADGEDSFISVDMDSAIPSPFSEVNTKTRPTLNTFWTNCVTLMLTKFQTCHTVRMNKRFKDSRFKVFIVICAVRNRFYWFYRNRFTGLKISSEKRIIKSIIISEFCKTQHTSKYLILYTVHTRLPQFCPCVQYSVSMLPLTHFSLWLWIIYSAAFLYKTFHFSSKEHKSSKLEVQPVIWNAVANKCWPSCYAIANAHPLVH